MSKHTVNSNPLSYLMLCDGIGLGGLELQMLQRVDDAHDLGNNATLACSKNGRLWKHAEQNSIHPERIEFNIPYYDPFAILRFVKIARKHKIDVCVVGQSRLLSQVLIARKVWRLPMSVIFYQQMQSGLSKRDWFHNLVYSSLDAAIVLTQQMKGELQRTTVMPEEKIHVVPYGVRAERFASTADQRQLSRIDFSIPPDSFVIGCLGRLDSQKDQMLLLNAFARSVLPRQSILVLAGDVTAGSEAYRTELLTQAEALGIADRLIMMPFTSEIARLLACFDVFVLPSRSETFGLVLVEAMAAGLPVVATDSGGVPEIIEHEKTGLLFHPRDEQALCDHLSRLAHAPEWRTQLGKQAQSAARDRYDYNKQTALFFQICRETHVSKFRHNR